MDNATLDRLETILSNYRLQDGTVVTALQEIQNVFGYLPEDVILWFARKSGQPASRFFGGAPFYSQLSLKARGRHTITACCGTVCHVKGSAAIITRIKEELQLAPDETTSKNGQFTLEEVACIGACSIAPVVVLDKKVYGGMTMAKTVAIMQQVKKSDSGLSGE